MKKMLTTLYVALLGLALTACTQNGNMGTMDKKPTAPIVDIGTLPLEWTYYVFEDETIVDSLSRVSGFSKGTFSITQSPAQGTWNNLNIRGDFSYKPSKDFTGDVVFKFIATDEKGKSKEYEGKIVVVPVNDAPVLTASNLTLQVGTSSSVQLQVQDPDSSVFSYVASSSSLGSVSINSSGLLTFTASSVGQEVIYVKANDGSLDSNIVPVSVRVYAAAQSISNYSIEVFKNTPYQGALAGANIRPNTTVEIKNQPAHGSLTLSGSTINYIPNNEYVGSDSFSYVVHDELTTSNEVTVAISVINRTIANAAPTTEDLFFVVNKGESLSEQLVSNVPGSLYEIVSQPTKGTITLNPLTGTFTYVPSSTATGTDGFSYVAKQGSASSGISNVVLEILDVNNAPVTSVISINTNEDTAYTGALMGTDANGDLLTYSIVSTPSHGTVSVVGGNFTYTPTSNYNGTDSFSYRASDGQVNSNVSVVSVKVLPVNDAPVANNGSFTTEEEQPLSGTFSASDVDGDSLNYEIKSQPTKGVVMIQGSKSGSFLYIPKKDAVGIDSFTFQVNDGKLPSNIATITINITDVNDAPVAIAKNLSTNEDVALNISLEGLDVEGDALSYIIVTPPAHGTLSGTVPNLVYTPALNYNGPDSFTFKVNDGTLDSNVATIAIDVIPVNDAPVSQDQVVTTAEDVAVSISLYGFDVDGDVLTYTIVSGPSSGTLSGSGSNVVYTPNANFQGVDTFTYKINDGSLDSIVSTVTVNVTSVNDAPVSSNLNLTTNEDVPVSSTMPSLDVDGDALTYVIVNQPAHGTVSFNSTTGAFTYTPNLDYVGSDSFTFKTTDGSLESNVATVNIQVLPVNDLPVAYDDTFVVVEDTATLLSLSAFDVDGDTLTYTIVSGPSHGTLSGTGPNFTYTPTLNYNGPDSFTFRVNDGSGNSNVATVGITVTPVNDAPVANNQSLSTNEETALNITLTASDVDGDTLTYTIVSMPTHGTLTGSGVNWVYTPSANYNGPDSFTFKANDGSLDSNVATVAVNVISVNDAPVANAQTLTTPEDTALNITLTGSDADGDALTYTIVSGPAHGTLSGTVPNLVYTPALNYNGPDSFTFRVNDGTVNSSVVTVSITVTPVNDAPTTSNGHIVVTEDVAYNGTLTAFDVDGDALTYSVVSAPSNGTVTITNASTGAFTYTPALNYNGPDSFTFRVNDGTLNSNVSTVTGEVLPVNDSPVSNNGTLSVVEDTPKAGTLSATDPDGDALTYSVVSQGSKGTVTITNSATGAFTYTPNSNANGSDSFTFRVFDGTSFSNTATVSVNITPVNDAPVWTTATSRTATTERNTSVNLTVNATDVDGDTVSYSIVSASNGTASVNSSGVVTFNPTNGFVGTATVIVSCSDGTLNCSPNTTITVTVTNNNTAPVAYNSSVRVEKNSSVSVPLDVYDAEGNTLTYSIVSSPTSGTLSGSGATRTYTPSWTFCSNENGTCSFTGTKLVRYGLDGLFYYRTLSGGTACTNAVFGDPNEGTVKSCHTMNLSDSFTFRANDGSLNSNTATVSITIYDWALPSWSNRKKITLSSVVTSDQVDFPALIKLTSSRIDYSKTKTAGADIRFVDESGATLSFEIEKWTPGGESIIWLKVPRVKASSSNSFVWVYYGNSSATNGQNAADVWSNGYVGVWHLNQTSGQVLDSTANANHGTSISISNRNATGYLGSAFYNSASNSCITIPHHASQAVVSRLTAEAWVKEAATNSNRNIFRKEVVDDGDTYLAYTVGDNGGKMTVNITDSSLNSTSYATIKNYMSSSWAHIAMTYDDVANKAIAFSNGNNTTANGNVTRNIYTGNKWSNLKLFGSCNANGAFLGTLDELRLSKVIRSEDWIKLNYLSMTDGICSYGSEQNQSNATP